MPSGFQGSKQFCSQTTTPATCGGYSFANTGSLPARVSGGCSTSPRRHSRIPARTDGLFVVPAFSLELPADTYTRTPACWWGRDRWIAHNLALYDTHYRPLYQAREVPSVGRETFERYLRAESGVADTATGRNARITMRSLQISTKRSESTMHRCRKLTRRFATRTVVFEGRHRTLVERLASWRRGDTARGWAAVAVLHESSTLPVDNQTPKTRPDLEIGTPLERISIPQGNPSFEEWVSSLQPENDGASRCTDERRRRRSMPAYDQRAVKLAASVRRDERFPLWVREIQHGRLTALLTSKAVAGWDVDDVYGGLEEWRIAGKKSLLNDPINPPGYLLSILRTLPDDVPPARLDRARTVQIEETERAERARAREEARSAAMAAVPMNPAARRFRDQLAGRTRDAAGERARARAAAERELAIRRQ